MGQLDYKGAPHTFEGAEFVNFLHHLKTAKDDVSGPGYSRKIEDVFENAFTIAAAVRVLAIEGNYLLLTEGPWACSPRSATLPTSPAPICPIMTWYACRRTGQML